MGKSTKSTEPLSVRMGLNATPVRRVMAGGRIVYLGVIYHHLELEHRVGREVALARVGSIYLRVADAMGLVICNAKPVQVLEVPNAAA
jgi:hypothetical protein